MLFASTGRFTPLPGRLWAADRWGTRGTGQRARVVTLSHPAHPCGTLGKKPPASPSEPALPDLPRGLVPSCPGRRSQTWTGDRPAGRGQSETPAAPFTRCVGAVAAAAARGAEEGLAGGSITLLVPEGLPQTIRFCAGIKGGLWQALPSGRAAPRPEQPERAGRGSVEPPVPVAPCLAGAAEGPGEGSAAGARPGS